MKVLIKRVAPGVKRVLAATEEQTMVGYLSRRATGEWVAVDHQIGLDVVRTDRGYRVAAKLTREYFAGMAFCSGGCGRLTRGGLCHRCADGGRL